MHRCKKALILVALELQRLVLSLLLLLVAGASVISDRLPEEAYSCCRSESTGVVEVVCV
jgi:hypothetical protein